MFFKFHTFYKHLTLAAIRKQLHSDRKNMDIFTEKRLHPGHDNPINLHYKENFDTVFIAFSPFFKIKQGNFSKKDVKSQDS
jgi:hypothetical protein